MSKKFIILLTVFIDILGIGIIIPILPFYVESFGVSDFVVTLLFAVFSLFAFLSAPLLGAWSDKVGRRPVLIVSIFSTALGWLVFAAASNVFFLFLGRIIDGLAAGNFSIAQSYLIDISKDQKEKTHNLGLIGMLFGVGLIVGPLLGALLSSISLAFPFWFVGALALFNFVLALINLPETHHQRENDKKLDLNPLKPFVKIFSNPNLRWSFVAWFLFGLALANEQSIFSLYLNREFSFSAAMVGFVTAAMGLVLIFNQVFALKKVWLKYFKEEALVIWMMLALSVGFFLMGLSFLILFISGIAIISLAHSVFRAVMTSQISQRGEAREQGMIMGLMNSVMSLSMIIGPLLAGLLFGLKRGLPFIAASLFTFIAFVILFLDGRRHRVQQLKLSAEELMMAKQRVELIV